jgi:hypothetical protein
MTKTIKTADGKEFTVGEITVDQAEAASFAGKTGIEFNKGIVLESLRAAGDTTTTLVDIGKLPFFGVFAPLQRAAMEINGLAVAKPGESEPAAPAE